MPAARATAQIHAVVGSDEAEIKRAAAELAARLGPGGDFGSDIIDGTAANADDAAARIHATIDALLTFPFLGGEKLVWLKNANFLADSVTGRAADVIDGLEKLAATLSAGLPESTRFLLSAIDVDKRRSFYKTLQKLGKVLVFDRIDTSKSGWEEEAAQMVRQLAAPHGLGFDGEALELFVLATAGDRRAIESELEKLDLFLGPDRREATADDVRLVVPSSGESVVFELGNAIAARDLPRSLALLDQLLFQKESPVGILLVAIIPTVRNLLLARDLIVRHRLGRPQQAFGFAKMLERLPGDAVAHLPRKKDGTVNYYSLGIAACHAHRYEPGELRAALEACLEANVRLVSTSLDPEVLLSELLVRVIGKKG